SAILTAEGEQKAAVLRAEGDARAAVLRAEGESEAIIKVVHAIHEAKPDSHVLAYQYLQTLPEIAQGSANKVWVLPSELTGQIAHLADALKPSVDPGR
ncbi:MAG: peptidase, partial [Candidatus Nanopelagicales bacterium]